MIEFFLEIPTLTTKIQCKKIQNNTYSLKNPLPFSSGCPHMQDIRVGISKKDMSFFTSIFILILDKHKICIL